MTFCNIFQRFIFSKPSSHAENSMKKSNDKTEKRSDKRFQAKENVFAAIKRENIILCKVANISKGGLLFYSEDLDAIKENSLEVDLYIDDHVYVQNVPVKIISDFTTQDEQAFDGFPIRYLRLSFDTLNKTQKDRLIKIIEQSHPDSGMVV
jgi:hypothetical protein